MFVSCLVNNEAKPGFESEHGLSLYIETKENKLLFDTGKSKTFLRNAFSLQKDINAVDFLILSHGHYDHGGGIIPFLIRNAKACLYLRPEAFKDRYSIQEDGSYKFIGISKNIRSSSRIQFTKELEHITSHITLFSNVKVVYPRPSNNQLLFEKKKEKYVLDHFEDEQHLIIQEGEKNILISGCSHQGILNIVAKAEEIIGHELDVVIGGFHLYSNSAKKMDDLSYIDYLAKELAKRKTTYYTLHCTGIKPYEIMKEILGDQLIYLYAGDQIKI